MSFFSYLGVFLAFISKSSTIINLKIVGGISRYNKVYTITIDFTRFTRFGVIFIRFTFFVIILLIVYFDWKNF